MRSRKPSPGYKRSKGFSIVELMVSILIGLIILAGVVQVVVSSKTSFMGQEEMSFIQENARYAVDVIGKDIQGAGYWGCAGADAKVALVARVGASASQFLELSPLVGFDDKDSMPASYRGDVRDDSKDVNNAAILPDSILVRGFQGKTLPVEQHEIGSLTLGENHSFKSGSYVGVVASDCSRLGIFRADDDTANKVIKYSTAGNHTTAIKPSVDASILCPSVNCDPAAPFIQLYSSAATVMAYESKAYYIGTSKVVPGVPALKRAVLEDGNTTEQEIALGVENMQILYGVRSDNGDFAYKEASDMAAADWNGVYSVQVNLLFRSQTPVLPQEQAQDDLLGNDYKDRFARQVVSSTFRIRNRI